MLFHIYFGEIKRFIRDDGMIKVSRSLKELSWKINNIRKDYESKYNEEISIDKIANILKIPKEDVAASIAATSKNIVSSMYEPIKGDEKVCLLDTLKSDVNEENNIADKMTLEKLISELEPRDKQIILLRYYKGKTQMQVSEKLGIRQVQVSRIEKRVLLKMREKMVS